MAYLAVSKPKAVYQLLSSKMVDPPEGSECGPATHSQSIWKRVLVSHIYRSCCSSATQGANLLVRLKDNACTL